MPEYTIRSFFRHQSLALTVFGSGSLLLTHLHFPDLAMEMCSNSVGNPPDQMTKCMELVTIFSPASGRIFLEYFDLYLMESVQIKH